jgi:hypothetical protein
MVKTAAMTTMIAVLRTVVWDVLGHAAARRAEGLVNILIRPHLSGAL